MKANFLISEDERNRILGLHLTENSVHGTSKNKELIKEIQNIVKGTAETLADIGKTNKVFFQDLKAAMEGVGITGIKSVEEFSAAVKDGKITATDAVKVYSKLFEMNKSLAQEVLATVKESPSFKDLVNLSFPQGKAFLNAEGKLTAEAAKKMELIKNYYAKVGLKPEAIEGAIKELKAGGLSSEIKFAGSGAAKAGSPKGIIGGIPKIAKVEGSALGKELAQGGLVKDASAAGIKTGTNVKIVNIVDGKTVIKNGPVEMFQTGKEYFIKMPLWQKVASIGALAGLIYLLTGDKDASIVVPPQADPLLDETYFPTYVMQSDCQVKPAPSPERKKKEEINPVNPVNPVEPVITPIVKKDEPSPNPDLNPNPPKPDELAGRTDLTKGECKGFFQIIDSRDEQSGGKTANEKELITIKACLQQYNFIGDKHGKLKRRYGLSGSGGDKAI
jgi:hypothetical protein